LKENKLKTMEVKLVIQKSLMPGIPSAKAYQLVFTDEHVYFLFLSRDWGGFGGVGGNVLVAVAGAVSHNTIAEKLKEIQDQNLDELISKNKNSAKASYAEIKEFSHKKKNLWSGNAYVQFKLPSGGFKFCFEDEESREAIVAIIAAKRSDLVR
jgi:hypothetical protein